METRKITFILESANTVKTIQSSAETLGELKRELDVNGIDYQGKVFREGLSRTELLSDEAILPTNVPWRGATTNELVFTLVTENKNIKSGAYTRRELYDYIQEEGKAAEIAQHFNKNYTQVKSAELEEFLFPRVESSSPQENKEASATPEWRAAFNKLIRFMVKVELITAEEAALLLVPEVVDCPYNEAELEMLKMK